MLFYVIDNNRIIFIPTLKKKKPFNSLKTWKKTNCLWCNGTSSVFFSGYFVWKFSKMVCRDLFRNNFIARGDSFFQTFKEILNLLKKILNLLTFDNLQWTFLDFFFCENLLLSIVFSSSFSKVIYLIQIKFKGSVVHILKKYVQRDQKTIKIYFLNIFIRP